MYIYIFAPVISASIHRYVNYFDIQVLMMVAETETLTSTLHYNIFTYLDYAFSAKYIYILYVQNVRIALSRVINKCFFYPPMYCFMTIGFVYFCFKFHVYLFQV